MRFDIKAGDNLLGKGSVSRSGRDEVGIKGTGHIVIKSGIQKKIGVDQLVLTYMRRMDNGLGLLLEPKEGEVSKEHRPVRFHGARSGEIGMKSDLEQEGIGVLPFDEQQCQPCKQGNPSTDSSGKTLQKKKGIPTELAFVLGEGLTLEQDGDSVRLFLDLSKAEARINESPK